MSQAGTPSSDPWVILSKERLRYEELFKALKPVNGIVTGDQAKGFLLQSQLPPLVLGQIWALADTDADGKMDINEFSIACKLINLKLRGYDVPKVLPPVLLASLKTQTPPAIPPLPNASLIHPPPRPEPPKVAPVMAQPMSQAPLIPSLPGHMAPLTNTIPTGIVPPMQSVTIQSASQPIGPMHTAIPPMQSVQPLISGIPPLTTQPLVNVPPISTVVPQTAGTVQPLISGVQPAVTAALISSTVPSGVPLVSSTATISQTAAIILPSSSAGAVSATTVPSAHMSPVGSTSSVGPGATSTPRASITSLDKNTSSESSDGN